MKSSKRRRSAGGSALSVEGHSIPVSLRTHPRARRFSVRVKSATREVVIVHPIYAARSDALAFAYANSEWIASQLAALPRQVPFAPGETVPVLGDPHRICHLPQACGGVWADPETRRLTVTGRIEHVPRRLADWFRTEARRLLTARVAVHVRALGLSLPRVTLRDTSSRWGSCSPRSGLSFSWRLAMAPEGVLDYVAAHECAHLKHLHHGPAFWALVERLDPDYEAAEQWLKHQGSVLHAYGPVRRPASGPAAL
ncbi:MAG: M48 family metallopeptidase [Alphaproteobacteria bacterium]|nr:M48 family metallopeptidase [Alphaproteobacteria bacterium]